MASAGDIRIDVPVRIRTSGQQATIFDEVARQRRDRRIVCALVDGGGPAVRLLAAMRQRYGRDTEAAFVCLEDPRTGDRIACALYDLEAACRAVREQLRDG